MTAPNWCILMKVTLQKEPFPSPILLPQPFIPHSLSRSFAPLPSPIKTMYVLRNRFTRILKQKSTLDLAHQDFQIISLHRGRHHQSYLLAYHRYRIKEEEPDPFKSHSPPQFPVPYPLPVTQPFYLARPRCTSTPDCWQAN